MAIDLPEPEPVEGDPFGLHDPLTFDDLCRIEEALSDGCVTGAERDRLQGIYKKEMAPVQESFKNIGSALSARLAESLPDFRVGVSKAFAASIAPRTDELMKKIGASLMPKIDIGALMPKYDYSKVMPKIGLVNPETGAALARIGANAPSRPRLDFAGLIPDGRKEMAKIVAATSAVRPITIPRFDADVLVDRHPSRMEKLAREEIKTLQIVADELKLVAQSLEESEHRATERDRQQRRITRRYFWAMFIVPTVVTIATTQVPRLF